MCKPDDATACAILDSDTYDFCTPGFSWNETTLMCEACSVPGCERCRGNPLQVLLLSSLGQEVAQRWRGTQVCPLHCACHSVASCCLCACPFGLLTSLMACLLSPAVHACLLDQRMRIKPLVERGDGVLRPLLRPRMCDGTLIMFLGSAPGGGTMWQGRLEGSMPAVWGWLDGACTAPKLVEDCACRQII